MCEDNYIYSYLKLILILRGSVHTKATQTSETVAAAPKWETCIVSRVSLRHNYTMKLFALAPRIESKHTDRKH